jgi:hypothetical protein
LLYFKSPKGKGKTGEFAVKHIIGQNIENVQYVFNDYMILNNGKSSQIDHILVCAKGVFVIETKNYSGLIYGNESQREWTQVLQYGKVKNKLYNPVKQNATHAYYIRNILPNGIPIIPVVVFVQNNVEYVETDKVIGINYLPDFISIQPSILSAEQINRCYNILLNANSRDMISNEEHVKNIQDTQWNIANNICPRCGKPLVLRNGKYGQFYGCSEYPKCKFTKHID